MSEKKKISIPTAAAQWLGQQGALVITRYELATVIWRICKQPVSVDGSPLRNHKEEPDRSAFHRHEATLVQNGVLRTVPHLPEGAAYILVGAATSDARVLACAIDPFCYISHLSAME